MERDYTIFIPEFIAGGWAALVIALELFFPKLQVGATERFLCVASGGSGSRRIALRASLVQRFRGAV